MTMNGRKILLGITGGIAAYKSAHLCRLLVKDGGDVRVIMSESACEFITPLTMETLSGKPVPVKMFGRTAGPLEHIDLPAKADIMIIAPATADYLARCAAGRACDLISSVTLAFTGPVLFAPAMNTNMWNNPATQRNVLTLTEKHGWHIVQPSSGDLACGWTGPGRMAEPEEILDAARALFRRDLHGHRVLVTAGPTVEDLDPVRFLSNRSTGRMGYAIAIAAARRGADVVLVSGPTSLPCPFGVQRVDVRSALEMERAVKEEAGSCDAVIMSAAVADYRPKEVMEQKIKKEHEGDTRVLQLVRNPDILADQGARFAKRSRPVLVGFALETQNIVDSAREKLSRKGAHIIVANLASDGLGGDDTRATIVDDKERTFDTGPLTKIELADKILDLVLEYWSNERQGRA